jgi:hypothetical protein
MNNQRTTADIEREIEDILLEYMSYPTYTRQSSTNNESGFTNAQLNTIINTMDRYNRTMQTYNQNMQQYLVFLQNQRVPEPETTRPTRNPYRSGRTNTGNAANNIYENTFTTLLSSFYRPRNMHRRPISSDRALTEGEINSHITVLEYNNNEFSEMRCPITWEDFSEGEQIYKINSCGHIFKKEPLLQWFSQHNHCPVCRGNVITNAIITPSTSHTTEHPTLDNADTIISTNSTNSTNSTTNTNRPRDLSNNYIDNRVNNPSRNRSLVDNRIANGENTIRSNATTILDTLLNGLFSNTSESMQTFVFDIPIYYDMSGNMQ